MGVMGQLLGLQPLMHHPQIVSDACSLDGVLGGFSLEILGRLGRFGSLFLCFFALSFSSLLGLLLLPLLLESLSFTTPLFKLKYLLNLRILPILFPFSLVKFLLLC
jgi:hypothetical protein